MVAACLWAAWVCLRAWVYWHILGDPRQGFCAMLVAAFVIGALMCTGPLVVNRR